MSKQLNTKGKMVLFVCILVVALIGGYLGGAFDFLKPGKVKGVNNTPNIPAANSSETTFANAAVDKVKNNELTISLDEWIGWKPILDANGGTTTQKGSIYDKLGLKLNIVIINDATQSSTALIKGELAGAGYTINRYAFLYPKFINGNVPVKMPYITNYSSGGDGIIAKQGINRIEDLVGKKIGVPRFSEAQTLVEWLLAKSSLTDDQVRGIRDNMVMFDTPDDAAKAFFGGQLDAAATWQPYLSQAQSTTGAKLLFSTKTATNLVLDGVVFRQDVMEANPEVIGKFIDGALEANSLYTTSFDPIRGTMPLFATESDENIKAMTGDATLANWNTNMDLMKGVSQTLFTDMTKIWETLGEDVKLNSAVDAFDDSSLKLLSNKYASVITPKQTPVITAEQKSKATVAGDSTALLKQTLTINFEPNLAVIKDESKEGLNKFVDTAKLLNGAILRIEGNTSSDGNAEFNKKLSYERAKAVAQYLQVMGIDSNRFIIIGNGSDKPVADNGNDIGRKQNRRTDIFFHTAEQ